MLDLSKLVNKYELIWFDGEKLHLELPSQALLMEIMKIEDIEDDAEQFKAILKILKSILNSNEEGRKFTDSDIKSIPLNVIELILSDYVNSINSSLGE